MNTLKKSFQRLAENNEAALIVYLTAGYPTLELSMKYIERFAKYADILEVGIPFSDPIADGRIIQYASHIALEKGVNLFSILNELAKAKINKPLVIMSYLNPLLSFGVENFFRECNKIGVAGLIVPDLVIEESKILKKYAQRYSVDLIQLIAPTSDNNRINLIGKMTDGFVYCISLTGTTGIRKKLPDTIPSFIKKIKSIIAKPVVVGFGVSKVSQIKDLSQFADGVVVGSRIIQAIKNCEDTVALVKRFKMATLR